MSTPRRPARLVTLIGALVAVLPASAQDLAVYFGGQGRQELHDVHELRDPGGPLDGSLLLAGGADSLAFLSEQLVPSPLRVEIPATAANGDVMRASNSGGVGFILHVSADLSTVLRFVHFPVGTARTVSRIRTTVRTGDPTGELFISGRMFHEADGFASSYGRFNGGLSGPAPRESYFIARLDANFVDGVPGRCLYLHNTRNPYDYRNANDQVQAQPWDVNHLGEVVFGEGGAKIPVFGSWSALKKLDPFGRLMPVPGWPMHVMKDGTTVYGANPPGEIAWSMVYGYQGMRGTFRSHSAEDFAFAGADSNGNLRPGRYPDDFFYRSHVDPVTGAGEPDNVVIAVGTNGSTEISGLSAGPGRTGRVADHPRTYAWKSVVFDKRTNDLYVAYELGYFWSKPADITSKAGWEGNHEFDPTIVAMDNQGFIRDFDRMKQESSGDQPDHYVDALDIDYAGDFLVALGRQHGDGYFTSWRANETAANPGQRGFKTSLNGTTGNIHIQWIGKYRLSDLAIFHSTFVAELKSTVALGDPYANPHYDGWPDQNVGWKDMNTTRLYADAPNPMRVSREGLVGIVMQGQRVLTTANAFQKTTRNADVGSNTFVRVYSPDLREVVYSSLLVGQTATGKGDRNVELYAVLPRRDRVLVAGGHGGTLSQMPTANPSGISWGFTSANTSVSGVFASLRYPAVAFPEATGTVDYPAIPRVPPASARTPRGLGASIAPGGPFRVEFVAEPGMRYRLQRAATPGAGSPWIPVGDAVGGDGPMSLDDPDVPAASATSGFWRLEVTPAP